LRAAPRHPAGEGLQEQHRRFTPKALRSDKQVSVRAISLSRVPARYAVVRHGDAQSVKYSLAMRSAEYYDVYWSPAGSRFRGREDPDLVRQVEPLAHRGTRCLDVGCGDGLTIATYLTRTTGGCIAVDVSQAAVSQAKSHGVDARLIDDAAELPFADSSFELVTCIEVLEHLFDAEGAAREIARVLVPGGHLVAQVPNVAHWSQRVSMLRGRFVPLGDQLSLEQPWRDPHIRFFTATSLPAMISRAGLDPLRVIGTARSLLADTPLLRRRFADQGAGRLSRALADRKPALFGSRLQCVASKP
jgi:2-polyprenyl-3-methyl-5-hydroxy-6-metoxy-1,4-benzoquinol methylase